MWLVHESISNEIKITNAWLVRTLYLKGSSKKKAFRARTALKFVVLKISSHRSMKYQKKYPARKVHKRENLKLFSRRALRYSNTTVIFGTKLLCSFEINISKLAYCRICKQRKFLRFLSHLGTTKFWSDRGSRIGPWRYKFSNSPCSREVVTPRITPYCFHTTLWFS